MMGLRVKFLSVILLSTAIARADYYYHPSYQQRQAQPIISLTLDPQEELNSELRVATREGRADRVALLLKQGANVNGLSDQKESALMYAARDCHVAAGKILLFKHAHINNQDKDGKTALMYAAIASCSPMVSLLAHKPGIEVRLRDKSGRSALDYAEDGASLYVQGPPVVSLRIIEWALRKSML